MKSQAVRLAAAAVYISLATPVHAESIIEYCLRSHDSNSAIRECISEEARKQMGGVDGVMCSNDRCLVKLECREAEYLQSCEGHGFKTWWESEEYGRLFHIVTPGGQESTLFQCGTCLAFEADEGPIDQAELYQFDDNAVLDIPKNAIE